MIRHLGVPGGSLSASSGSEAFELKNAYVSQTAPKEAVSELASEAFPARQIKGDFNEVKRERVLAKQGSRNHLAPPAKSSGSPVAGLRAQRQASRGNLFAEPSSPLSPHHGPIGTFESKVEREASPPSPARRGSSAGNTAGFQRAEPEPAPPPREGPPSPRAAPPGVPVGVQPNQHPPPPQQPTKLLPRPGTSGGAAISPPYESYNHSPIPRLRPAGEKAPWIALQWSMVEAKEKAAAEGGGALSDAKKVVGVPPMLKPVTKQVPGVPPPLKALTKQGSFTVKDGLARKGSSKNLGSPRPADDTFPSSGDESDGTAESRAASKMHRSVAKLSIFRSLGTPSKDLLNAPQPKRMSDFEAKKLSDGYYETHASLEVRLLLRSLLEVVSRGGTGDRVGEALTELLKLVSNQTLDGKRACRTLIDFKGLTILFPLLAPRTDARAEVNQCAAGIFAAVCWHGLHAPIQEIPNLLNLIRKALMADAQDTVSSAAKLIVMLKPPLVGAAQCLDPLIRALRAQSRESAIQALFSLAHDPASVRAFAEWDRIREILQQFDHNVSDTCRQGCAALLAKLAKVGETHRTKMIRSGAVDLCMAAVEKQQVADQVMIHSLEILRLLVTEQRALRLMSNPLRMLHNRGIFDLIADVLGGNPEKTYSARVKVAATKLVKDLQSADQHAELKETRHVKYLTEPSDLEGLACLFSLLPARFICGTLRRVSKGFLAATRLPDTFVKLDMTGANLDNQGVDLFIRSSSLLYTISADFSGCAHVGVDGWEILAEAFRGGSLEVLTLKDCVSLTDEALMLIFSSTGESIRSIDVSGCINLTSQHTTALLTASEDNIIEAVRFNDCEWVEDDAVILATSACRKLNTIAVSNCPRLTAFAILGIAHCSGITSLDVSMNPGSITDETVTLIARGMPALRYLDISACDALSPDGFASLASLVHLRYLDLGGNMGLSDEAVSAVVHRLPHLITFKAMMIPAIGGMTTNMLGSVCLNLKIVDLSFCAMIPDVGFRIVVRNCIMLEQLSVPWCESVTARGMEYIASFGKRLVRLNVSNTRLEDAGLVAIGESCLRLQHLTLVDCHGITIQGLEAFVAKVMARGGVYTPSRLGDPPWGLTFVDARGVGLNRTGNVGKAKVAALQSKRDWGGFGKLNLLLGPAEAPPVEQAKKALPHLKRPAIGDGARVGVSGHRGSISPTR